MNWLSQWHVRTKDMMMSRKLFLLAASAAFITGAAPLAQAADIFEPPVIDLPEPVMPTPHPGAAKGGWYIRGDIGYQQNKMSDVDYITASIDCGACGTPVAVLGKNTLRGELSDTYSVGGGIGYDTGDRLRLDLTADYFTKADFRGSTSGTCTPTGGGAAIPCTTTDTASYSAIAVMANAYIDFDKYNGVTPYVGAGIGGTHVEWGPLTNKFNQSVTNPNEMHPGGTEWRFTYAVMAGASYDVSDCVAVDAGYRYRKVSGGHMFGIGDGAAVGGKSSTGGGKDNGITSHDFKVGARYKLGGCNSTARVPDYQPDYQPVYK
jgi:opacity protein-like surface antigen